MNQNLFNKRDQIAAIAWVSAILIYLHPYYGIRHDSVLYLGQGLLALDPENFQNDLFFAYGSQASFTVLPRMIGLVLSTFSAAETFKVLTFLSLCAFAGASWILLTKLFQMRTAYWGLVAVVTLPSVYGGYSVISYAEGFFTGRSLAEPLTLAAIALYLVGRPFVALVAVTLAAMIHPLQALPGLLVAWIDLVRNDRRWLWLLTLPMAMTITASLGVPVMQQLLQVFDAEWLTMTREANPMTMLSLWQTRDWMGLATDGFLVTLLIQYTKNQYARRLGLATILATGLALAISFVGADLLHLVRITGIQIWRTHWLLHWLAMASVPFLLSIAATQHDPRRARVLILVLVVICAAPTPTLLSNGLINCALIPLYWAWPTLMRKSSPAIQWLVSFVLCGILVILMMKLTVHAYDQYQKYGGLRENVRPEFLILSHPLVMGGLMAAYCFIAQSTRNNWLKRKFNHLIIVFPIFLLAVAMNEWDRRTPWTSEIEKAQSNPQLFGVSIERGAQVFWEGELAAPWLILGRPSYYNGMQAAGVLFNRETAIEGRRRQNVQKLLEFQTTICKIFNELNIDGERCNVDVEVLQKMCTDSTGFLQYLVLESKVDAPSEGVWKSRGGVKNIRQMEYHLYSCEKLKQLG